MERPLAQPLTAKANAEEKEALQGTGERIVQEHVQTEEAASASGWVPLPSPSQVWAHSCCRLSKLEAALADPSITALEADVRIGTLVTPSRSFPDMPVMAHPPSRSSDLSFHQFLERCIKDGRRHLKLDFKDIESVEWSLPMLAAARPRLLANGQAVWINADVLPGPGCTLWPPIKPERFLEAIKEHCPGTHLSLGWSVNPLVRTTYSETDCAAMAALWKEHAAAMGAVCGGVVFAVALRLAEREPWPLVELLQEVAGSQLLLWTGTWEPPVRWSTLSNLMGAFNDADVSDRCGYDCQVLSQPSCSARLLVEGMLNKKKVITSHLCRCTFPMLACMRDSELEPEDDVN